MLYGELLLFFANCSVRHSGGERPVSSLSIKLQNVNKNYNFVAQESTCNVCRVPNIVYKAITTGPNRRKFDMCILYTKL